MLEKEEVIKMLRGSTSYMDTHRTIQALKKDNSVDTGRDERIDQYCGGV